MFEGEFSAWTIYFIILFTTLSTSFVALTILAIIKIIQNVRSSKYKKREIEISNLLKNEIIGTKFLEFLKKEKFTGTISLSEFSSFLKEHTVSDCFLLSIAGSDIMGLKKAELLSFLKEKDIGEIEELKHLSILIKEIEKLANKNTNSNRKQVWLALLTGLLTNLILGAISFDFIHIEHVHSKMILSIIVTAIFVITAIAIVFTAIESVSICIFLLSWLIKLPFVYYKSVKRKQAFEEIEQLSYKILPFMQKDMNDDEELKKMEEIMEEIEQQEKLLEKYKY